MRILVAEDEQNMNYVLKRRLTNDGYTVDSCFTGTEAMDYLNCTAYDAVVLDIMLPEKDGFEVLKELRESGQDVPVLLLSAKSEAKDIVKGLDAGADDYLTKPFDFSELSARLRLILRKKVEHRGNIYSCGGLQIDTAIRQVTRDGKIIQLSPREYSILLFLLRNKDIVVTREQIVDNIYNIDQDINSNVIDAYIRLLRKKVDRDFDEKLIYTIRGMGYVLKSEES